jgi:enamine deaminase RidA (YjgF/YER057c/UK114 family)
VKKTITAFCFGALILSGASGAQDSASDNLNITGHGKTALIPSERMKKGWYDSDYHFSPAVRAGDFIFISGTVAGAFGSDSPVGEEGLKTSLRRAFGNIQAAIAAGGATMNQIVKIRTFHVFDSEWVTIPKVAQIKAVADVKGEFMGEPHAAWTAVGTTALFPDKGLVEIEVVVYAPLKNKNIKN